jgi:hypothetical protein
MNARSRRRSAALLLGVAAGCGSEAPVEPEPTPTPDAGTMSCESVVEEHPPTSTAHITECLPVSYDTNPPSGGQHYGVWAAFQNYDYAIPQGYLVHSLEHGAVVFWYNCPGGCPEEVASARAFINALPADPLCSGATTPRRVILVPEPALASRWAASSWGFTLNADCLDTTAMRAFYTEHHGNGPEDFCAAGVVIPENRCR